MTLNPEFVRNLWTEFSPHRLIAMPLIIGIIASLVLLTGEGTSPGVGYMAAMLFLLIVVGWGTRHAASAVVDELNTQTWDGQRMSAIGPWEMTWGKLFGGTAYMWYGGLLCLIWFAAVRHGFFDTGETALYLVFGILVGVIAHAVSLLMSLLGLRKRREVGRRKAMFDQTAGIVVALIFLSAFGAEVDLSRTLVWYGGTYSVDVFVTVALAAFTAWAVLGTHQMMRIELQLENGPWAWLAFVIFGIFFAAGFSPTWVYDASEAFKATRGQLKFGLLSGASEMIAPLLALWTALSFLYLIALIEAKSGLDIRRLAKHLRFREWSGVMHRVPRTALTALIAIVVCLWATGAASSLPGADEGTAFLLAVLLFALRDVGFIYYLNLATASRNADIMALLYLALLYSVIPGIFQAMSAGPVLPFFWPTPQYGVALTVLPVAGEVVVVYLLLAARIRKVLTAPM